MSETKALVLKAEGDVQMVPKAEVFKVVIADGNSKTTMYAKSVQVHNGMTVLTECTVCDYMPSTVKVVYPIYSYNHTIIMSNGCAKPHLSDRRPQSAFYGRKVPIKIVRSDKIAEIDGLTSQGEMDAWAHVSPESARESANSSQETENRSTRVHNCRFLPDAVQEYIRHKLQSVWGSKSWIDKKFIDENKWIYSFLNPKTPEKKAVYVEYAKELAVDFFDEEVFDRATFDETMARLMS